ISRPILIRTRLRFCRTLVLSPRWPRATLRPPCNSSGRDIFVLIATRSPVGLFLIARLDCVTPTQRKSRNSAGGFRTFGRELDSDPLKLQSSLVSTLHESTPNLLLLATTCD